MSPALVLLFSESAPGPFQYGIRERGGMTLQRFAALQTAGPRQTRLHLIHRPARDIIHHAVARSFLLSDLIFLELSCRYRGLFPGPRNSLLANPDAVQDHGQPTRQRRSLSSSRGAWRSSWPTPEPRPLRHPHQHGVSRLQSIARIISSPHLDIPPVRSISPDWYSAGVRPNTAPTALELRKRAGIDGGAIGQRHHRADPGHRHQAPAHIVSAHDRQQATMKDADLLAQRPPDNQQRFDRGLR